MVFSAFTLIPVYATTPATASNAPNTGSLCPTTTNSERVLIATSIPVAAIVEDDEVVDRDQRTIASSLPDIATSASAEDNAEDRAVTAAAEDKKQIASSLPVTMIPPIDMSTKQRVSHPDFIPTCAFTNDEMVTPYHESDSVTALAFTQELPKRIKLDPKVAKHWTGAKVEPFWVNTTPDKDHPGTFAFSSEIENGPKGWLQYTGERSAWGHPEYRYWFDPS